MGFQSPYSDWTNMAVREQNVLGGGAPNFWPKNKSLCLHLPKKLRTGQYDLDFTHGAIWVPEISHGMHKLLVSVFNLFNKYIENFNLLCHA